MNRVPARNKRILITGAAGAIGRTLRAGLQNSYELLRLSDVRPLEPPRTGEETAQADLTDLEAVRRIVDGMDCVVHLGGVPREGPWESIHDNNIIGTYNVFDAARELRVGRVVYASSNHVVGYYRVDRTIGIEEPIRPDSRYAVSKAFGEALGRLYADKHGLSVACLRIGSFRAEPEDYRQLATWISPRDMIQLARRCIDAAQFHYLVLYGVSANTRGRWNNSHAERIGYRPQDNAEAFAQRFSAPITGGKDPALECHGGSFCGLEFDGDLDRIE